MKIEDIARICHQANKAYCEAIGDYSNNDWEEAPRWQRESAIKGVEYRLKNLSASNASQHEQWMEIKRKEGWKHGPVKNSEKKEHPCFLPYNSLPEAQRLKDALFSNIIITLHKSIE